MLKYIKTTLTLVYLIAYGKEKNKKIVIIYNLHEFIIFTISKLPILIEIYTIKQITSIYSKSTIDW
jgi:hypothetical protein